MKRVRLLPIVIVAASGLFVLKATELVSSGRQVFDSGAAPPAAPASVAAGKPAEELPKFARAWVRHRFGAPAEPDITGSVPPRKEGAQDLPKEPPPGAARSEPVPAKLAEQRPPASQPSSERAVLERLQERRGAIDDRARELDMRENLLQAAERKLDGRISDLKDIEGRIDATAKAEQAEVDKQLRNVVVMYEAMKPKDAARVFDRLKLDVLVPIATAMKPARMSEILAAMSSEGAERLTVALASRSVEAKAAQPQGGSAGPPGELPRIDNAPARPRR